MKKRKNTEVFVISAKDKMVQWSDWRSPQEHVSYDERERAINNKMRSQKKNNNYITVTHTTESVVGYRKCFQFLLTRPRVIF